MGHEQGGRMSRAERRRMARELAKHAVEVIREDEIGAWGSSPEWERVAEPVRERERQATAPPGAVLGREALYTTTEVAQLLRVHPKTIEQWRKRLGLPCLAIGGRVRFDVSDVLRWASARKEA